MHHYHLQLLGTHWALVEQDSAAPIRSFATKNEGVSYSLAFIEHHGGSLTIHRLDGTLQEERTYPGGLERARIAA